MGLASAHFCPSGNEIVTQPNWASCLKTSDKVPLPPFWHFSLKGMASRPATRKPILRGFDSSSKYASQDLFGSFKACSTDLGSFSLFLFLVSVDQTGLNVVHRSQIASV